MTLEEIMTELEARGSQNIKNILLKHGVKEPFFGVKIEYLKPIQKKIKKDYKLAHQLYQTNNADAMYLAGLIADDEKMTKDDLQQWVQAAVSTNISAYTVPWVTAGSHHGFELAMEWIDSDEEHITVAGWATLGGLAALKADKDLNIAALKKLVARVEKKIHSANNLERGAMNGFLISLGCYVESLTDEVIAAAKRIGPVTVIKEGTACKTPDVVEYIQKVADRGSLGKKKKVLKC